MQSPAMNTNHSNQRSHEAEDVFQLNATLQKEIQQNELNVLRHTELCVETEASSLEGEDEESNEQRRDSRILRQSCKVLRAQLQTYKPVTYPCEPWFLGEEDIETQLRERVRQTEECISLQEVQRKKLIKNVEQESKVNLELEELLRAGEKRLKSGLKKKQTDSRRGELQKRCTLMAKGNADLEKKMVTFTTKNYPLPDEDTFKKLKKKEGSSGVPVLQTRDDLMSLQDTVQQLIDAAVSDPNDPFIEIDHRHWPPYMSLLQRMDLATEHPEDINRIKLMPFYL